jgi:putative ABC transport system permease protein
MALSLVLLISAALLLRSIQNAYKTDPGFEKKNLVLLSTELDLRGYADSEGLRFYQRLIDHVRSLPGLRSVSLTSIFPLSFASAETEIIVEGSQTRREGGQTTLDKGGMSQQVDALPPKESLGGRTLLGTSSVAPGYFETMGIPLVQGREFSYHDTLGGPGVIIINQSMASRFWPRENPIGKRVNIDPLNPQGRYYEVIGVAQDSKFGTLRESAQPFMYMCILQQYSSSITLVARVNSDPGKMLAVIRREVQSLDADLPVFDVKTVTEHLDITLFPLRMASILIGMLGALAMLLSVVGLYAVVAYSVTLRTRELGIRMALGASSIHVLKSVITRGTLLAMIGIAIGLALSLVIAHAMSNLGLLYGISAIDPASFLTVSLLLISVAMLASYIPARRATRIDPVNALRQ